MLWGIGCTGMQQVCHRCEPEGVRESSQLALLLALLFCYWLHWTLCAGCCSSCNDGVTH